MESRYKKSSTSPDDSAPLLSHFKMFRERPSFFKILQKSLKKCLTTPGFSRIIAYVERLTSQTTKQILGICIVVVR